MLTGTICGGFFTKEWRRFIESVLKKKHLLHWIILFCFYWNWEAEKCISLPLFIRWKKEPDKLTSNYIKLAGFAYFSTLKKHMQCWNKKCFSKAFANWHKKIKRCSAFIWRLESGVAELLAPVWGGVMGDFHPSHREFCCNMSSNINQHYFTLSNSKWIN